MRKTTVMLLGCVATAAMATMAAPEPVVLMDEQFTRGEMINSIQSDRIPAGWRYNLWHSKAKTEQGGLSKDTPANPPHALAVLAVKEGMGGWYSLPQLLSQPSRPLSMKLKYRLSEDYAGNAPVVFIGWLDAKKQFVKPLFLNLPATAEKGRWLDFAREISTGEIPAQARYFTVNLISRADKNGVAATGKVYFDLLRITMPPQLGSAVRLRGNNFANWWMQNEPVVFRAEGQLPSEATAVSGTVYDSGDREVAKVEVPAAQFRQTGWSWKASEPGFYRIAFAAVKPGAAMPLNEEFIERAWISNQIGVFALDKVNVAVVRKPAAGTKVSNLFGFQITCSPRGMKIVKDLEIRLAKIIGASFLRFHVEWFSIEPEKGKFNWEYFDYYVNKCVEAGLKPAICFYGTPRWASRRPDDIRYVVHVNAYSGYAAKNLADWENFVTTMVERYKDRVDTWEVWNEPHLPTFSCYWHDSPENFVGMLKTAYEAIKKVQPKSTVWLGGVGMRYLPFYDTIIKLGAGKYFDVLALHGHGVNPAPFFAIDREYRSPVHPWVDSEWHASLVRSGDEVYKLNEQERSLRMLLDLLRQVRYGVSEISFFELVNLSEKEALDFFAAGKMPLNHASGLFRRKPYLQPLLGAVVMNNFTAQFRGPVKLEKEFRLGQWKAVLMSSQAGPLLVFWQETGKPLAVDPALAAAVGNGVISWEGRQTAFSSGSVFPSHTMYFGSRPQIPASWQPAEGVLVMTRKKQTLRGPAAQYGLKPLIGGDGKFLAANAVWIERDWRKKFWEKPSGNNAARYAMAVVDGYFELAVEVVDPVHKQPASGVTMWQGDGIQFAIDTTREGYADDRCEFQAGLTLSGPQLVKEKAPSLVGDLPTDWTPPGGPVKNGFLKVEKLSGDKRLYLVRMKLSELYPLVLKPGDKLRFSLLVNDNNGQTRAGWLNWGDGIGDSKDPVLYGTLTPAAR